MRVGDKYGRKRNFVCTKYIHNCRHSIAIIILHVRMADVVLWHRFPTTNERQILKPMMNIG